MPLQSSPKSNLSEDSIDFVRLTAPLYSGDCVLTQFAPSHYTNSTAPIKTEKPKSIPKVAPTKNVKTILKQETGTSEHRPKTPSRRVKYKKSGLLSDKKKNAFQRNRQSYLNQFRTAYKLPGSDLKSFARSESVETIFGGSTQSSHSSLNEYLENQAAQISQTNAADKEAYAYLIEQNQYLRDKHEEEAIYNEIRKQNRDSIYNSDSLETNRTTLSDVIKEERLNIPYSMNGTLSLTGNKNEIKKHESEHKKAIFKKRNKMSKKLLNDQEKKSKNVLKAQRTECVVVNDDQRSEIDQKNCALKNKNTSEYQVVDNKFIIDKEKQLNKALLSTDHEKIKNKLNLLRKRSEYGKRIEFKNQTIIKYSKNLNQIEGVDKKKICFRTNNKNNNINKNKNNNNKNCINNNVEKQEKKIDDTFKRLPESTQLNTLKKENLNKCQREDNFDDLDVYDDKETTTATFTDSLEKVELNNNHNESISQVIKKKENEKAPVGCYNESLLKKFNENKINNQFEKIKIRKMKTFQSHTKNIGDGDCTNIIKTFDKKSQKLSKSISAKFTNTNNNIKNKNTKGQGKFVINCKNNNNRVTDEAIDMIKVDLELLKLQHINDMRLADDIRKLITTVTEETSLEEKKKF